MKALCLAVVFLPLAGALLAGLGGRRLGVGVVHWLTSGAVGCAFLLSLQLCAWVFGEDGMVYREVLYAWQQKAGLGLHIGFLIDPLSVTMMAVVTFVSWMVHIYSIGYMRGDPGYRRFFSYISLFTFAMLMLVTADNFLQLFFGWEGVGLVSYLLIGFWFQRPSAISANLKAFLVNRAGDLGLLLGIAGVFAVCGSLDYQVVFEQAAWHAQDSLSPWPGQQWPAWTFICVCLFIGAMGKSAQAPLHVWLPDSMEGPTPISALIHAATMVTAGIFMVARMSPLFELSETALTLVMAVGAFTALSMGLLGVVQHDIKRVIAYSTLSQLGYMTAALGASAYAASIFHLVTHAFFKALLFLAAGSFIIALHHEQDLRRMGGLRHAMPITSFTMLIGALALVGFPATSGFYSKDALIEAVALARVPGAGMAVLALQAGVFVTALYTFRMLFLACCGEGRMEHPERVRESPPSVRIPLLLLAVPSAVVGIGLMEGMLFGDYFGTSLYVAPEHDVLAELGEQYQGPWSYLAHSFLTPVPYLAAAGALVAWYCYLYRPQVPALLAGRLRFLHNLLLRKYGFDRVYERWIPTAVQALGRLLWRFGDKRLIDGFAVNGAAYAVRWMAGVLRLLQTGYLYHYAFAMIFGLLLLMGLLLMRQG